MLFIVSCNFAVRGDLWNWKQRVHFFWRYLRFLKLIRSGGCTWRLCSTTRITSWSQPKIRSHWWRSSAAPPPSPKTSFGLPRWTVTYICVYWQLQACWLTVQVIEWSQFINNKYTYRKWISVWFFCLNWVFCFSCSCPVHGSKCPGYSKGFPPLTHLPPPSFRTDTTF